MTIVMKKSSSAKEILDVLEKIKIKKIAFKPDKFSGKLKRGLNGLKYQKQLRNEWE